MEIKDYPLMSTKPQTYDTIVKFLKSKPKDIWKDISFYKDILLTTGSITLAIAAVATPTTTLTAVAFAGLSGATIFNEKFKQLVQWGSEISQETSIIDLLNKQRKHEIGHIFLIHYAAGMALARHIIPGLEREIKKQQISFWIEELRRIATANQILGVSKDEIIEKVIKIRTRIELQTYFELLYNQVIKTYRKYFSEEGYNYLLNSEVQEEAISHMIEYYIMTRNSLVNEKGLEEFKTYVLSIDHEALIRGQRNVLKKLDEISYKKKSNVNKDLPKELTFVPRQNPEEIIGRKKELEDIFQLLSKNKHVVVVNGMGGIGKTTLAEAYVFQYYNYYRHILWITQTSDDLATDITKSFSLHSSLEIKVEGKNPERIFQESLHKLTNIEDSPKLFVIDNASRNLSNLISILPQQPNWHLLVTSREEIDGLNPYPLDFLSEKEAIALFLKHFKRANTWKPEFLAKLVGEVEYHTLTIEILAKTARRQNYSISTLRNALKDDLKANVKVKHRLQKIERITSYLSSIFKLNRLTDNEIWLLKQFVCLPNTFYTFGFLKEIIVPQASDREEIFSETLAELAQKGWLTEKCL